MSEVTIFKCTDRRILKLTPAQNREEVFAAINGNRIYTRNSFKTKNREERKELKKLKKSATPMIGKTVKYACV